MLDGRFSRVTSYADTRQDSGEISGGNMGEWISIKNRMPETSTPMHTIWVWANYKTILSNEWEQGLCRWLEASGRWTPQGSNSECEVSHWIPLPPPPESSNTDFNLTPPTESQVKS